MTADEMTQGLDSHGWALQRLRRFDALNTRQQIRFFDTFELRFPGINEINVEVPSLCWDDSEAGGTQELVCTEWRACMGWQSAENCALLSQWQQWRQSFSTCGHSI